MSLPPLLTRYNFNFKPNFHYCYFTTLKNGQKMTIKIIFKYRKWNNKWKLLSYFLGYFEELKFAKRTFKQNLRTRQISASFPGDSSVYHGNVKCWLKRPGGGWAFSSPSFPWFLARNQNHSRWCRSCIRKSAPGSDLSLDERCSAQLFERLRKQFNVTLFYR